MTVSSGMTPEEPRSAPASLSPWLGRVVGMAAVDVVVVGGGAAGCVVAARLAEGGSRSVMLLEAGPDRRAEMPDVLRDGWSIEREAFDRGYRSTDEPPKPVRRKRVVGGTSWLT